MPHIGKPFKSVGTRLKVYIRQLIDLEREIELTCQFCKTTRHHDATLYFRKLPIVLVFKFEDPWTWQNESETCFARPRNFLSHTIEIKDASKRRHIFKLSSIFYKTSSKVSNPYACYLSNGDDLNKWLEISVHGVKEVPFHTIQSVRPLILSYVRSPRRKLTPPETRTAVPNIEPIQQHQI